MELDPTGADFPLTWDTENTTFDWSGVTTVVICRICHDQIGPQFSVRDAQIEASYHHATKHLGETGPRLPHVCADCGASGKRLARNICSICRDKRTKAWLIETGFMHEDESLSGYKERERASRDAPREDGRWAGWTPDKRRILPCPVEGCQGQYMRPHSRCEHHRREQTKRQPCTAAGCTRTPHAPHVMCFAHRKEAA